MPSPDQVGEKSGGNVNYYLVEVIRPKRPEFKLYVAECEDIIEALQMTFAEGCAFKALWRSCAARTLGKKKAGGDEVYDAEKLVYYSNRVLVARQRAVEPSVTDEVAALEKEQKAIDSIRKKHPEIPMADISLKRWAQAMNLDLDAILTDLEDKRIQDEPETLTEPEYTSNTKLELVEDEANPITLNNPKTIPVLASLLGTLARAATALNIDPKEFETAIRAELALKASCNCCAPLWQEPS